MMTCIGFSFSINYCILSLVCSTVYTTINFFFALFQNWYSYQYSCVQVLEFLKKKQLVPDLLRHIGTSAISDLLLRLVRKLS